MPTQNQTPIQQQTGAPIPPKAPGSQSPEKPRFRERGRFSSMSALIIGLSIIISVIVIVKGFLYYKTGTDHYITATGSASVDFDSDLIVWRGSFSSYAVTSKKAYDSIKNQAFSVNQYLTDNGLSDDEIVFSSVEIDKQYNSNYDENGNLINSTLAGYSLEQQITVTSKNIDTVEKISRDISSLLDKGVEFSSQNPEYYCTTLNDVKLDLIDKATENAKDRIDIMAKASDAKLGKLTNSNLGVFQITAQNSGTSDYSYDGSFDTRSRHKTASITVKLQYAVQ
jgi:hypothetical protein